MTVANVLLLDNERALVCSDSEVRAADGLRQATSKLFPIVHMPAIICGRGVAVLMAAIHGGAVLTADFDALLDAGAELVSISLEQVIACSGAGLGSLGGQCVVMVGWSARERRMVLAEFNQRAGEIAFDESRPAYHVAPWANSLELRWQGARTVDGMVKLAEAQVRLLRREAPEAAAGGPLVIALLERENIAIRRLDDAQHREQGFARRNAG